jgi:putative sigma-54 modulation protein
MDILGMDFELTPAIAAHVESRVGAAVENIAGTKVQGVMVRLGDLNGTRGGVDKVCRIVVWPCRDKAVVARAVHRDLYRAVDEAAFRLREALRRRVRRRMTLQRGPR